MNTLIRSEQYRNLLNSTAPIVKFSDVDCFARDTDNPNGLRIIAILKDGREEVLYA